MILWCFIAHFTYLLFLDTCYSFGFRGRFILLNELSCNSILFYMFVYQNTLIYIFPNISLH